MTDITLYFVFCLAYPVRRLRIIPALKNFGKDYVEGCFFDIVKDPFTFLTFLCSNRLLLLLLVNPGFSSMFSGSWLCAVDLLTEIGLELGSRAVKSRL